MQERDMEDLGDKIAAVIREDWGNRLIDMPDGETRWVLPVRAGGSTDQLIDLAVDITLGMLARSQAIPGDVKRGDVVLVEGVATGVVPGEPYGTVTVAFPFCTDPQGLLDGVTVVAPRVIVYASNMGETA
jgi:hypothetical protein